MEIKTTTRRNNMFYYRGACSAYSTILKIMKEIEYDGCLLLISYQYRC